MAQYKACHSSRSSQTLQGHVGHRPRQHGGIKNPPGHDTIQRQAALQALATCALACFNPTPLCKILCQTSMPQRQEYHCTHWVASSTVSTATVVNNSRDGRDVRWRLDFLDWHGPQRDHRQAFALALAGRTQRQGAKPQRQCRVSGRLRPPTWHLQLEVGAPPVVRLQ